MLISGSVSSKFPLFTRFLHHRNPWLALGFATPKSLWELQALGARVDELTATGSRLASEITHAEVIIWFGRLERLEILY